MENRTSSKHSIDYLCILLLLFLFIATGLMVITVGTGIYKKITDRMEAGSNSRLVTSYYREKARQAKSAGSIYLTDFDGTRALALAEDIDGTRYVTCLYLSDGNLTELFASEETIESGSLKASSGTAIMKLTSLSYEEIDPTAAAVSGESLILIDAVTENGSEERFYLSVLKGNGTSLIEETSGGDLP